MWFTLSGLIRLMALAAAIALFAAVACGGNDVEKEAVVTATPPATESGAPAFPSDTPAPRSDDTVPGEVETEARKLLADKLNVDEGEFTLDSAEGAGWSDASLGCPQEGMMYAQVITPGYKLVFDFEGTLYQVHTNSDGSHMVICGDGESTEARPNTAAATYPVPTDTPYPTLNAPPSPEPTATPRLALELATLHEAILEGNADSVQIFVDAGADVNDAYEYSGGVIFNRTNITAPPLYWAIRGDVPEIVRILVNAGADVNATFRSSGGPVFTESMEHTRLLDYAIEGGKVEIVQLLVDAGADYADGVNPVHLAVENNRANEQAAVNQELLNAVAEDRELTVIQALLDAGADLHAKDLSGSTPLHYAAQYSTNPVVIQGLLDAGADIHAQDTWGTTPLHVAAENNENSAVIQALLDAGADLRAKDTWGMTPLHYAAQFNTNLAVTQALLEEGGDIHAKEGIWGMTPLHLAAENNENSTVIQALLDAGADINAKNNDGHTPLDVATDERNSAAIRLLQEAASS